MTVRERVIASRLIHKIDNNERYARQIGLSCAVSAVEINGTKKKPTQKEAQNTSLK